jgi:hypothetical protein
LKAAHHVAVLRAWLQALSITGFISSTCTALPRRSELEEPSAPCCSGASLNSNEILKTVHHVLVSSAETKRSQHADILHRSTFSLFLCCDRSVAAQVEVERKV